MEESNPHQIKSFSNQRPNLQFDTRNLILWARTLKSLGVTAFIYRKGKKSKEVQTPKVSQHMNQTSETRKLVPNSPALSYWAHTHRCHREASFQCRLPQSEFNAPLSFSSTAGRGGS